MTKPSWSLPPAERSKWGTPAPAPAPAPLSVKDKSAFPPLGGAKKASLPAKSSLDFRTAAESGAKSAAAREEEYLKDAAYKELLASASSTDSYRARLSRIGNRSFDDGPEDYDGPEEDELYEDSEGMPAMEETEFNAHLAVVRRSGDAGVW